LDFNGGGGSDVFSVRQNLPYNVAAIGDGDDQLVYRANLGDATNVDLFDAFITTTPLSSSIKYYGISNISLDGESGSLTVFGTPDGDSFGYTPSASDAGTVNLAGPYPT